MAVTLEGKNKFVPPPDLGNKCPEDDVRRFITDCMKAVGVPQENALLMADILVEADKRGHYSHGLLRTEMYLADMLKKLCDPCATPTVLKENASTALVDGNNGLGPVVSKFCMDLAIKKARETGIGWICNRGSNHYGIAGVWAMKAAEEGMIGMSFTNTSSLVVPTRSVKPVLGTNPIALAAPAEGGNFVLDMATSVVAGGKVEKKVYEGKPLPENWSLDKEGNPTTDAKKGLEGFLLPLGGAEETSGYKGFGLGMMVEIFCGIMSGGTYGPNIRDWTKADRPADISHCFVAIDPSCFAPGFESRLGDLMNYCRNVQPVDPQKPVMVAGDPERINSEKMKADGGITYDMSLIEEMWKLAKYLGVKPLQSV
ncbi:uncharacterized oxidoreductase YjmC-like isoform X1 [Palaemon carinicauda]|uniref:uncharacterized oxidoreductase YjmC-like isoform X1 n=2 Tax=Palaemon carinicauda TaxID=392227 RepID=UPI0035B5B306